MIGDADKRKCKRCGEEKLRIASGKFPNRKDKRWVDESRRQWMGNICGLCNVERSKEIMQKSRNARKKATLE